MMRSFHTHFSCLLATMLVTAVGANEKDFYRDVYPFLKANCISCHNKTTTKAGLNMETPELMIKGGDSGPSIVPGKSAESILVEASIHTDDMEMPPPKNKTGAVKLTSKEIAVLKQWIDEGAKSSVQERRQVVWQPLAEGVDPIYTVAMTGDGRFAACGRSNQISLYDLATRSLVGQIEDQNQNPSGAHRALVNSLAFSPDGKRLASGSYQEVKIWRKEQKPAEHRKGDPALGLEASVLSADGKTIVGSDKSGALLVLHAADGKVIRKIEGVSSGGAPLLSLSPDATTVAVFNQNWKLSLWNLSDGKLLASRTTPDPELEQQAKALTEKHVAATRAESAAVETQKNAQVAKAAATKALADAKAAIAKAPGGTPDEAIKKQLLDAETRLAAATTSESAANAAVPAAKKAATAAGEASARAVQAKKTAVRALAWTGDGKAVVTAGDDTLIRIWSLPPPNVASLSAPKILKGATGAITALVAGAKPDQVISAGADNKVRIWSLTEAKVLREIPAAGILSLALSPDGKQVASGGSDGAIRLWDTATGKQISELRGSIETARQIAELEWTIAGQALEQAFQRTVVAAIDARTKAIDELLKKANDAIVASNKALPVTEKAVKPLEEARLAAQKVVDEAAAAIGKAPGEKADPKLEAALKAAQDKLITAQTAENDAIAAFKAVQSNIADAEAQKKRITDTKAENDKKVAEANAASEAAKALQAKATADLATAKAALAKVTAKPLAVAFSSKADQVAAAFEDGSIRVWAVASGMPVELASGSAMTTASLFFQANGSFVSCASDAAFTSTASRSHWVLERMLGGEKEPTLFADRVNAVCFSPDGKTLATGGGEPSRSGDITLFALADGKLIANWKERHSDSVVSLDFSPDGKLLASGAADKIARVTEVATGEQVNLFEGHTHYVTGVAFRSDGRVLATAGADGVVNSWDMISGERKKKIEGWTKEVTSLQFIGATNQIVTSAGDNLIRIINDDGAQIRSIAKLPDFMQSAASTPNGSIVIGGGEDSFLRVWNGTDGKEIAAFGMQ